MLADAEIPIPAGAYFLGNILKVVLLRPYSAGGPLIGIVIIAALVPLKDIGSVSIQRFSQVFQQYPQRLVRSLLQQGSLMTASRFWTLCIPLCCSGP